METVGALGAAAPILESIPNPLGGAVGPEGGVVVIRTLLSDRIPILLSSAHRWC